MTISKAVRTVLLIAGLKQNDLADEYGMSKQTMSNKMTLNRWKGEELLKAAKLAGCKLAFVLPDGTLIEME